MIKILKKAVRVLDSTVDSLLLLVFLLLFLIGVYGLYDSYLVYLDANDTSILKYKPGYDSGDDETKEILDDMVAWLTLDDTNVDYPIMQGEDNNEYLNKNPYGDYALSGSIFLDSRNAPDFSDYYSLVYGHHMEHDMMFGALDKYLDEDYFYSHQTGTLFVKEIKEDEEKEEEGVEKGKEKEGEEKGGDKSEKVEYSISYKIRLFAVIESEGTQEAIFAPTECDDETLDYVKEHAVYLDDTFEVGDDVKLIALSTCKYPDTADRTIVFGYLLDE